MVRENPFNRKPDRLRRWLPWAPVALLVWGLIYVNAGELIDHYRFPRIGHAVDIGGRSLNLYCSGTGSPTVVFESGFGQPGLTWTLVQPRVAKKHRACWYDRAGLGWSDEVSGNRYSDSIAVDLHKLLRAAGIAPPYVLVGHSIAGFHIRVFHAMYPDGVVGLVMVDPSNEDIGTIQGMTPSGRNMPSPVVVHVVDAVVRQIGLWRWFMHDQGPKPDSLSQRDWDTICSLRRDRRMIRAVSREGPERGSAAVAKRMDALDSVPLVLLTRGNIFPGPDTVINRRIWSDWVKLSGELAHRSSRGEQVVVPGSGHFIQYSAPQAVVDAVERVLAIANAPVAR